MKAIFFLTFLCITNINAKLSDSSYWDANLTKAYIHNSEMQRRWAMAFIAPFLKTLKGTENILDVGCGDGKITADISKFVPEGSVVGIDLSEPMIEWAQKQYHPLEYPNLSFQVGSFLEPNIQGQFDLIVSFCALQHSFDQQQALSNLANLLKPNGKLLILVPTRNNPAWNNARANTQSKSKWAGYWQNVAPRKSFSAQRYAEFLGEANLSCISIEMISTMDPFIDKNEIIEWLCGTFAPAVPIVGMHEFYSEWIDEYVSLAPDALQSDGVIYAKLGYIAMFAIKK